MKTIYWIASSLKDLKSLPEEVQDNVGFCLYVAQGGGIHKDVKPLKGFGGAGVLEVVENHKGDTYRAVYTVQFSKALYVLHVFQKKAKRGITTPHQDIDRIKERLKAAEEHYKNHYEETAT